MTISTSDVRRDKFLENFLYANVNRTFIADLAFTPRSVKIDTGPIAGINDDHLREFDSERALYDRSTHEMTYEYKEAGNYAIGYNDLAIFVPKRLQDQALNPFEPKRDAGIVALNAIKLKREVLLANKLTSTAVMIQNVTLVGPDKFSDESNSNPDSVIQDAIDSVFESTGVEPNSMIISREVFNVLKRHPFFLSMLSGIKTVDENVLMTLIKSYFNFTNVYVAKARKVTSKMGQTVTMGNVWNNDIIVYYKGEGLFEPTLGFNLTLTGHNLRSVTYPDPLRPHGGDFVEVENAFQDLVLKPEAGYLIKGAV